jgi:general stress protein 26
MELETKILEVIRGPKLAALATVKEESGKVLPAVRYIVAMGFEDLSLMAATRKSSGKVQDIKKNPNISLTIWSGKDLIPEDLIKPYVVIKGKAELIDDQETKNRFWNPYLENHFHGINDPEYGLLKFVPNSIEYYHGNTVNVWAK